MKKIFVIFLSLFLIHAATADDVFNTSVTNGCASDILGFTENVSIEPVFEPQSITCSAGQYLPVNTANCETCPAESTCTAGTYTFNETKSQGVVYNDPFTQNKPKGCAENILGIAAAVSFEPVFELKNIQCASGYYLAANNTTCSQCTSGSYCPGGTYTFSETDDQGAIACPTGYDYNTALGKTSVTQCQIHCDGGTWNGEYTQLEYIESTGTQYIDTGIVPTNYNWSASFRMSASGWGKYFFGMGTTNGSGYWGGNGYQLGIAGSAGSSSWGGASSNTTAGILGVSQNVFYNYKMTKNGFYVDDVLKAAISSPADYVASSSLYLGRSNNPQGAMYNNGVSKWAWVKIYDDSNTLVFDGFPARRNSDNVLGMYDAVTGTFFTNSGTGTFIAGPDVGAPGGECVDVGVGYWAAASTVNFGSLGVRTACPVGTTTVGYGHGADSANDCGRVLHIGDYVLYARRDRVTSPSLNIRIPEEGIIYYINLGSENHDLSRLQLMLDGVQYTAYDDSLYYGERNFDTGQQITQ